MYYVNKLDENTFSVSKEDHNSVASGDWGSAYMDRALTELKNIDKYNDISFSIIDQTLDVGE